MNEPGGDDGLAALPPLRDVIRAHGLAADKRFGQHFLTDPSILARIARAAGQLDAGVTIEVGPGPGGLTRALLAAGAGRMAAIEIDPRCVAIAEEIAAAAAGRLQVIAADALETDVTTLGPAPRRIVANLPYNIATPLLVGWLGQVARDADAIAVMILMFQREVADRLAARPGAKTYGRLSVLAQWLCRSEKLFDLPGGAFTPPPKVASSVVRLTPLGPPPGAAAFAAMERTTAAAFGQRRKMLRQSLKTLGPHALAALDVVGIDPTRRAETLTVQEFAALAGALFPPT
ncbi:MAG: 16S rRNA (adenine(1518)-N(6)/adenine(1519)-N(6))-dimethyltransferase RsmA [Alphaproteobacteria bacterium]